MGNLIRPALATCALLLSIGAAYAGQIDATPATQPADVDARHRLDDRWRQIHLSQINNYRTQWAHAQIVQTFKPGTLVQFSLSNGLLKGKTTDLAPTQTIRVAVEGSKSIWLLNRSPTMVAAGVFPRPTFTPFVNITRYDLDAKEGDFWNARVMISDRMISFYAQSMFSSTSLSQSNGILRVAVSEYTQWAQPQKRVYVAQASSLSRLRADNPEPFRLYVLPLLAHFGDTAFLQLGAADVYGVFPEIPADQKVTQELTEIIPDLDATDPVDRETASDRLLKLGPAGVLAAMRLDDSQLSEEQKLRIHAFISGFRRRPVAEPEIGRRDLAFLIDCLEFDDPSVRLAAKAELERQTDKPVNFDPSLTGKSAASAVDIIRKQILAPAPVATPATQPSGAPAPQV